MSQGSSEYVWATCGRCLTSKPMVTLFNTIYVPIDRVRRVGSNVSKNTNKLINPFHRNAELRRFVCLLVVVVVKISILMLLSKYTHFGRYLQMSYRKIERTGKHPFPTPTVLRRQKSVSDSRSPFSQSFRSDSRSSVASRPEHAGIHKKRRIKNFLITIY